MQVSSVLGFKMTDPTFTGQVTTTGADVPAVEDIYTSISHNTTTPVAGNPAGILKPMQLSMPELLLSDMYKKLADSH